MDTKNSGVIFGDISKNITPKSHRYFYIQLFQSSFQNQLY